MITFIKRLSSTIVLLSIFYVVLFTESRFSDCVFLITAVSIAYMGSLEFGKISSAAGYKPYLRWLSPIFSGLTIAFLFMDKPYFYFSALVFLIYTGMLWGLFLFSKNQAENLGRIFASAASYFLLVVPCGLIVALYKYPVVEGFSGSKLLIYLLFVTKIGDIGAYAIGTLSNVLLKGKNHKMFPVISPKKSYEGAVGGLLATLGLSIYLMPVCLGDNSIFSAVLLGTVLFFGGMSGDLAESAFKRMGQIKDSGFILPGIGGILDLIDSLMINVIIFFLYLVIRYTGNIF